MNTRGDQRDEPATRRLHALDAIRDWPEESRRPASWIIHVHHEPDQVSETELVWEAIDPWHRIIATREFEERPWPVPHTASVRSVIRYDVPRDRTAAVESLDLALEVDRSGGLVEVVGPDLRTNLLAFNLMHDVVTGALQPDEARRRYADITTATPNGHPPADMVKCRFDDLMPIEPDAVPPSDPPRREGPSVSQPSDALPPSGAIPAGVHEAMPTPPTESDPTRDRSD